MNTSKNDVYGARSAKSSNSNRLEKATLNISHGTSDQPYSHATIDSDMNTRDNIYDRKQTLEKLRSGISKTCSLVEGAYGAAGGNVVVVEDYYPFHRVTNDGKTIVDKVQLADPVEQIGANFIKEAGDKADKDSGDGRKTTMILTKGLVDSFNGSINPIKYKRELDKITEGLLKIIEAQSIPIDIDSIKNVATIASEDETVGELIQEIYQHIGKDGIIEYEQSGLPETFYELHEGIRFRGAGFFGQYSCTDQKGERAVYEKPLILVSREKITSIEQIEPLYRALSAKSINTLVIFADEVDMAVASRLAFTHIQGQFKTHIIRQPNLFKDFIVEDFCKATGAKPVSIKDGRTFTTLTLDDLGTCDRLISTADETRLIGIKDISEHVQQIKEAKEENYQLRLAWLQNKAAVLKVGANSETELSYKIKKAKDGIAAAYQALQEGVVCGGGLTLYSLIDSLPDTEVGNAMAYALGMPITRIIENGGEEPTKILSQVNDIMGYNAQNGTVCNLLEENIVDPTIVVKNALKNAVSIAGTVLTVSRAVTKVEV